MYSISYKVRKISVCQLTRNNVKSVRFWMIIRHDHDHTHCMHAENKATIQSKLRPLPVLEQLVLVEKGYHVWEDVLAILGVHGVEKWKLGEWFSLVNISIHAERKTTSTTIITTTIKVWRLTFKVHDWVEQVPPMMTFLKCQRGVYSM